MHKYMGIKLYRCPDELIHILQPFFTHGIINMILVARYIVT